MDTRRGFMRALAGEVSRIATPVLGKRGFATAQLVAEWPAIVGADLAQSAAPERLSFPRGERQGGTLRLRVAPACALAVQHRAPQIIERINGFFGYRAVGRLILVQVPPSRPDGRQASGPRMLLSGERDALDRRLAGIDDPALRDALRRLGEAVIGGER